MIYRLRPPRSQSQKKGGKNRIFFSGIFLCITTEKDDKMALRFKVFQGQMLDCAEEKIENHPSKFHRDFFIDD